ncbi:MAG TPA: alkaline phosphatase family protein [Armatimonadota bacterium]|nr:alkaline phosphatase family protein [Armatimonadota bacterium]
MNVIDVAAGRVRETLSVLPDPALPFGSAPNALAVGRDGETLFVGNGGNNAVAVVSLGERRGRRKGTVRGFLPAGWYPGGVVTDGRQLYVANVKGVGSRTRRPGQKGWHVKAYRGSVNRVPIPDDGALVRFTAQVRADGRLPEILRAWERARPDRPPVPVPRRMGEPSVFRHVVYVVKENRTYDQVFGDLPQGDGDPSLCIFGRELTPNHHALAEQFVLLDNFYCNGVLSADGHSWVTEGNVTDHLEKAFGGFTRSYTFGDDPVTYSSSGFIWDNVLAHGLSFRNFGEMDYAEPVPKATYSEIYRDFVDKTGKIRFSHNIGIERLRRYSNPDFPGWNMSIPDVLRVEVALKELREAERTGLWPNLTMVYLPNDHTSGTTPGMPTPRAHMADNDLALGRLVEALSRSRFWPETCIFVIEDDPQDGFDHVDGHRSISLVISPYTRRGAVVSSFYNQTSVLHTMERILGIPPMNQMDAMAPLMSDCFTPKADLRPYTCLPNRVPLDELNPPMSSLRGFERQWAKASLGQRFDLFDQADEDTLNRILWHSARGGKAPYPAHLAGAHGRGLRARRLALDGEDDD